MTALNLIADSESKNGYQTVAWTITFMMDCFVDTETSDLYDYDELKRDISEFWKIIDKTQSSFSDEDWAFRKLVDERFEYCDEIIRISKAESSYEETVLNMIKKALRH